MASTKTRCGQTEKKPLAIIWAIIRRFDEFVRSLQHSVETDYQPLVSLFGKMELGALPPRIQRLRLKLMQYHFRMLCVPGKLLATADTLSGNPANTTSNENHLDMLNSFAISAVEAAPEGLPIRIRDAQAAQEADGECSLLGYCEKGWPEKHKLPLHITKHWAMRGDVYLPRNSAQDLQVIDTRRILIFVHEGHQGVNKCANRASDSV